MEIFVHWESGKERASGIKDPWPWWSCSCFKWLLVHDLTLKTPMHQNQLFPLFIRGQSVPCMLRTIGKSRMVQLGNAWRCPANYIVCPKIRRGWRWRLEAHEQMRATMSLCGCWPVLVYGSSWCFPRVDTYCLNNQFMKSKKGDWGKCVHRWHAPWKGKERL